MSALTLPPPPSPIVLERSYKSRKIKGGTVIAEDILDLETHERKLLEPDEYRSVIGVCRACGLRILHAHCFRERVLRPASRSQSPRVATVRLFRCAAGKCGAVFTVLPAFIARHLWRAWTTVEEVAVKKARAPMATRRRWLARLGSSALGLVQLLMALSAKLLPPPMRDRLAKADTRHVLLAVLSPLLGEERFASAAGWIHRLEPGIRLM